MGRSLGCQSLSRGRRSLAAVGHLAGVIVCLAACGGSVGANTSDSTEPQTAEAQRDDSSAAEAPPETPAPETPTPETPAEKTDAEKKPEMTLTHDHISTAALATGDQELASWVAEPGSYHTAPASFPALKHHRVYLVRPDDTSHLMGFYIAQHQDSGEAYVLSGFAPGLASLIAKEDALVSAPEFSRLVMEWMSPQPDTMRLVTSADDLHGAAAPATPATPPQVTAQDGELRVVLFAVDERQRLKQLRFHIPASGPATSRWTRVQ